MQWDSERIHVGHDVKTSKIRVKAHKWTGRNELEMRHVAPTLRILSEKRENEEGVTTLIGRGEFSRGEWWNVEVLWVSVTPDLPNQAAGKFLIKHRSLPPARLHYEAGHSGCSPACCCWGCCHRKAAKGDQTNSDRCVWWAAMGRDSDSSNPWG